MLPDNGTTYCPHLAHLSEMAACGLKHIMGSAEDMKTVTDTLPDNLKPYGEALTKVSLQVLIESYVECLRMLQETALAAITPEHPGQVSHKGSFGEEALAPELPLPMTYPHPDESV